MFFLMILRLGLFLWVDFWNYLNLGNELEVDMFLLVIEYKLIV